MYLAEGIPNNVFASGGVMCGLNILLSLHRLSRGRMTYFKARPLQTQTLVAMWPEKNSN
jgi:hypothetical protein